MGLALATSIAGWVNMILLLFKLNKRIGPFDIKDLSKALLNIFMSSLIMGLLVWLFFSFYQLDLSVAPLMQKILSVLVSIGLGLLVYVSVCRLLNVGELKRVLDIFRKVR